MSWHLILVMKIMLSFKMHFWDGGNVVRRSIKSIKKGDEMLCGKFPLPGFLVNTGYRVGCLGWKHPRELV